MGTKNTVESLQTLWVPHQSMCTPRTNLMSSTNTHVPAPFWCAVAPVKIPLSSCNKAADALIEWFGPEDLKHVVGGERWWQIRGMEWLDGEWVTENAYLQDGNSEQEKGLTDDEKTIKRMEHLDRVMVSYTPIART